VEGAQDMRLPAYLKSATQLNLDALSQLPRRRARLALCDVGDVYSVLFARRSDEGEASSSKMDILSDDTWSQLAGSYDKSQMAALRAALRKSKKKK
jgi:hypothetical protein